MKKRIGVIGVGSAGIVTVSYLLSHLSGEWEVVSIYDPSIPILGIGESTNPGFIRLLELGTRFNLLEDTHSLDSTLKFGTKFFNWREEPWLNPLVSSGVAVHFNTFKLKEFAFSRFPKYWPDKFRVIEGTVSDIDNSIDEVILTINNKTEKFDYIVDCRGFPTDYTDYHISTCTLVNHCLVHSFEEFDPIQYTEHFATKNGWMFGIPLTSRKTYGYLFNDELTSIQEAKDDMAELLKISTDELDLTTYKFKPYYTTKLVNKRMLKNGNQALFFEPISALSINQYVNTCSIIFNYVNGIVHEDEANEKFIVDSKVTEDLINFYYHGGSTFNSKFWDKATKNANNNLSQSNEFKSLVDVTKRAIELGLPYNGLPYLFSQYSLIIMEEAFGYNYFKGSKFLWENDE